MRGLSTLLICLVFNARYPSPPAPFPRSGGRAAFKCWFRQYLQNPSRVAGGVGNRAFSEISGGGQSARRLPQPSPPPRIRLNGSARPLPNFVREGFACKNLAKTAVKKLHDLSGERGAKISEMKTCAIVKCRNIKLSTVQPHPPTLPNIRHQTRDQNG
ncbi:hypothetical protein Pla100_21240 [Neorhodopirellula pilleata]|uniref:Uncharacterized protein n=1 Tax=Neorhodopirellula pilleata TaxID=2714738 RepID=A0A5C6AI85_9BACT|nr:hypothetical protein Pla100_21240 [Neorhodopirellula pilleata]